MIVLKNDRINHYNGKVVTTSMTTMLVVDPNIEEAQEIQDCYGKIGGSLQTNMLEITILRGSVAEVTILDICEKQSA